jgi:hypothetical protein
MASAALTGGSQVAGSMPRRNTLTNWTLTGVDSVHG